jgi:hypothetical protein
MVLVNNGRTAAQDNLGGLSVEISLDRQTYFYVEYPVINATYKNTGNKQIKIFIPNSIGSQAIEFKLYDETGTKYYGGTLDLGIGPQQIWEPNTILLPGESYSIEYDLFPVMCAYGHGNEKTTIRMLYRPESKGKTVIQSNICSFTVEPPPSEESEIMKLIQNGIAIGLSPEAKKFMDKHPNSIYYPLWAYYFINEVIVTAQNSDNKADKNDINEALRHAKTLAQEQWSKGKISRLASFTNILYHCYEITHHEIAEKMRTDSEKGKDDLINLIKKEAENKNPDANKIAWCLVVLRLQMGEDVISQIPKSTVQRLAQILPSLNNNRLIKGEFLCVLKLKGEIEATTDDDNLIKTAQKYHHSKSK